MMLRMLIILITLLFAASAQAIPLQLGKAEFTAAISGLETIVEDFESTSPGAKSNPFVFANGRYLSTNRGSPYVWSSANACGESADRCLSNSAITTVEQIFSTFPLNTLYFGISLHSINGTDLFDISVIGGSGRLDLSRSPASDFFGFHDPLGLSSVSFRNRGTDHEDLSRSWSYVTFDDVITAVPTPTTLLLVIVALGALLRARSCK